MIFFLMNIQFPTNVKGLLCYMKLDIRYIDIVHQCIAQGEVPKNACSITDGIGNIVYSYVDRHCHMIVSSVGINHSASSNQPSTL